MHYSLLRGCISDILSLMTLSIITINLNNAQGLRQTIESVLSQTSRDFEYILIDGGSTDGSLEVINEFSEYISYWISEPDNGIYQAMNKGIIASKGDYCQFLNSGDILLSSNVTEKMLKAAAFGSDIYYGNVLQKKRGNSLRIKAFAQQKPTLIDFYFETLNHSPTYIHRSLFDRFGLYDETLKIVSDWKWFMQVIGLAGIVPIYTNIDVTLFDMNGISNIDKAKLKIERRKVLEEVLPWPVLQSFDQNALLIDQMRRISKYNLVYKFVWLLERMLFKYEKWF